MVSRCQVGDAMPIYKALKSFAFEMKHDMRYNNNDNNITTSSAKFVWIAPSFHAMRRW